MQLLHNVVLGKRKWLLSSPDPVLPLLKLEALCYWVAPRIHVPCSVQHPS